MQQERASKCMRTDMLFIQSSANGKYENAEPVPTCWKNPINYFMKQENKKKYLILNTIAVILHTSSVVAMLIVYYTHFEKVKPGFAFVSPKAQLHWTNNALIRADATDNKCSDVSNSPHFRATNPAMNIPSTVQQLFEPRTEYPDFMQPLFDFSGKTLIRYTINGYEVNLVAMMMMFCALSACFQTAHCWLLLKCEDMPRFMHYLEYSFSSPLMVMVMAVNVGIHELFLITSLGALFYAMNITGMLAEIMVHYAYSIPQKHTFIYTMLCWSAHAAGWVIFLLAMGPIWAQFSQVIACSDNQGIPGYAIAAIVLESFMFFLFGALQFTSMWERLTPGAVNKHKQTTEIQEQTYSIAPNILFRYDCMHATLSLLAKLTLAWLLLGPALSVDLGKLDQRNGSI